MLLAIAVSALLAMCMMIPDTACAVGWDPESMTESAANEADEAIAAIDEDSTAVMDTEIHQLTNSMCRYVIIECVLSVGQLIAGFII